MTNLISNFFSGVWNYLRRTDSLLWGLVIVISVYSMALITSVSEAIEENYASTQLMAIILGFIGAVFISLIDYSDLANLWHVIAVFSVFLMAYTAIFGVQAVGEDGVDARAWIKIAGRTFQSSELVKIAFLITLSKHLDVLQKQNNLNRPFYVFTLLLHVGVALLLCHWQGDDGAGAVFLVIFLAMAFAAGLKLRYFIIMLVLIAVAIPILWNFVLSDYQINRFLDLMNLDDPEVQLGGGWQQDQGRTSIGSGQFWGLGLGNGKRVSQELVSLQHSDFIFSVAGEELGFVGCTAIILLLLALMLRALHIGSKARDDMGKTICFGFFGMIALQSIINIGMCLALLPVMGVTLPFFSAGGSSAMCLYFGVGLLQSVYLHRKESDGKRLNRKTPVNITYKKKLR